MMYPKRLIRLVKIGTMLPCACICTFVNRLDQLITLLDINLHVATTMEWADRYRHAFKAAGVTAAFLGSGDALADALAADWTVDVVIVDLAMMTPRLAQRLGPDGPRVLAFGDAANAGAALAANLADFLPDASETDDLIAAVHAALIPLPTAGVADLSDRSVARLGALGADATRIAIALARLDGSAQPAAAPPIDAERLRAAIRARRARERFFPPEIFGEPAWDMILDLAAATAEGREVAVSSLCIAAAVPTTTALRWIKNLCDAGLFIRRDDPADARRAFVSLSDPALTAMARYLAQTTPPWP